MADARRDERGRALAEARLALALPFCDHSCGNAQAALAIANMALCSDIEQDIVHLGGTVALMPLLMDKTQKVAHALLFLRVDDSILEQLCECAPVSSVLFTSLLLACWAHLPLAERVARSGRGCCVGSARQPRLHRRYAFRLCIPGWGPDAREGAAR